MTCECDSHSITVDYPPLPQEKYNSHWSQYVISSLVLYRLRMNCKRKEISGDQQHTHTKAESRMLLKSDVESEQDVHKLYTQISACRHLFSRFHLYKSWGMYLRKQPLLWVPTNHPSNTPAFPGTRLLSKPANQGVHDWKRMPSYSLYLFIWNSSVKSMTIMMSAVNQKPPCFFIHVCSGMVCYTISEKNKTPTGFGKAGNPDKCNLHLEKSWEPAK